MIILNCNSITKPTQTSAAASPLPNNISPPPSPPSNVKPNPNKLPNGKLQQGNLKQQKRTKQPSVLEIERAIGAGIFRERDPNSESGEEKQGLVGSVLKNSIGMSEGSVERQLRETGEWLIRRSEKTSQRYGKKILMALYLWILPAWIFMFLFISGAVKLPFTTPYLQDLLS